jgi:hypothetical protein
MIDLDTSPRRADAEGVEPGPDGTLTVATGSELVLLNATAAAVYQLCDGETRVREMIEAAADLFDAGTDVVQHDILETLGDLESRGLIG